MITGIIVLEDQVLKFDIGWDCQRCKLTIRDTMSDQERELVVTNEQLGAIVGTAICGTNETVMKAAIPVAESAFPTDWPKELRPMP
jgi:hypothetical protein